MFVGDVNVLFIEQTVLPLFVMMDAALRKCLLSRRKAVDSCLI